MKMKLADRISEISVRDTAFPTRLHVCPAFVQRKLGCLAN